MYDPVKYFDSQICVHGLYSRIPGPAATMRDFLNLFDRAAETIESQTEIVDGQEYHPLITG